MALSDAALKGLLKTEIQTVFANKGTPVSDEPLLEAVCLAIAKAVVSHITTDAVVLPTSLIAPPGTAGGPVTGTGKVS